MRRFLLGFLLLISPFYPVLAQAKITDRLVAKTDESQESDDQEESKPSKKSSKRAERKKSEQKPHKRELLMFLPFGAGQFQNRDYIKGSILAFLQTVYFPYRYAELNRQADREAVQTNNYIVWAGGAQNLNDEQKIYVSNSRAWEAQRRKEAHLQTQLWLVTYLIGIVDAALNEPPASHSDASHNSNATTFANTKHSQLSANHQLVSDDRRPRPVFNWNIGLASQDPAVSVASAANPNIDLGLALNLKLKF